MIFCYLGLSEKTHSYQRMQFQSVLMKELCRLWGVKQSRMNPYSPKANSVVERGNRQLGDGLHTLFRVTHGEWDRILSWQLWGVCRTQLLKEMPNYLTDGRKTQIPNHLSYHILGPQSNTTDQCAADKNNQLAVAHELLRQKQWTVWTEDKDEPLLVNDLVWLKNTRRRKGENPKLQAKYVGPYAMQICYANHTYKICRYGQTSIQNERRLNLYHPCTVAQEKASMMLEAICRLNMKGPYWPGKRLHRKKVTVEHVPPAATRKRAPLIPPSREQCLTRTEPVEEIEEESEIEQIKDIVDDEPLPEAQE